MKSTAPASRRDESSTHLVRPRKGPWLQTFTGRPFYPQDPRPQDICIEDIAHALSLICRFGGHVREFYCVAQHSVLVSDCLVRAGRSRHDCLAALLHDASEAYAGDVVWPLKQVIGPLGYSAIEHAIEACIEDVYGLHIDAELKAAIKHADLRALATEKRDLVRGGTGGGAIKEAEAARTTLGTWHCDTVEPFTDVIVPLGPHDAYQLFMNRFETLRA